MSRGNCGWRTKPRWRRGLASSSGATTRRPPRPAGHLTTVVRRKTGRTVQQWITERRMQQARVLLAETDLTVAALARRVGYPDVSYFIKRFRADHGMTPAQWRHAAPPNRPRIS